LRETIMFHITETNTDYIVHERTMVEMPKLREER